MSDRYKDAIAKRKADPNYKQKIKLAGEKRSASKVWRASHKAAMQKMAQDPAWREKVREGVRGSIKQRFEDTAPHRARWQELKAMLSAAGLPVPKIRSTWSVATWVENNRAVSKLLGIDDAE